MSDTELLNGTTDPEILECLNDPVVLPSPIRTAEERHANPGPMTMSFMKMFALMTLNKCSDANDAAK